MRNLTESHASSSIARREWIQGDMDQGSATIAELAQAWLDNPRRAHRKNDSQPQNIQRALNKHGHRRKQAAAELGISERTLYRKIKEFGLK